MKMNMDNPESQIQKINSQEGWDSPLCEQKLKELLASAKTLEDRARLLSAEWYFEDEITLISHST